MPNRDKVSPILVLFVVFLLSACREVVTVGLGQEDSAPVADPRQSTGEPRSFPFAGTLFSSLKSALLTREHGLADTDVRAILQDREGYLWFGTSNGLHRYDGYGFKVFQPVPGNYNSLSDGWIQCMVESDAGMLWIGTGAGGVNRLDPKTGVVTVYRYRESSKYSLSSDAILTLFVDSNDVLWVGTDGGDMNSEYGALHGALNRFDPAVDGFVRYHHDPVDASSLGPNIGVRAIFEDQSGALWIGTDRGGLNRLDRASGAFERYRQGDTIVGISGAGVGELWIATQFGIGLFDPKTGAFKHNLVYSADTDGSDGQALTAFFVTGDGEIWAGGSDGTVGRFDALQFRRRSTPIEAEASTSFRFLINTLYVDREGILWVGTSGGGIGRSIVKTRDFYNLDVGAPATSITEDSYGTLWADTALGLLHAHADGILNLYDRNADESIGVDRDVGSTVLEDLPDRPQIGVITCVLENTGDVWIGSDGGGLSRFYEGEWQQFLHDPADPGSLSDNHVTSLGRDAHGQIWIGTNNGLNRFVNGTQDFLIFRTTEGLSSNAVSGLLVGADNYLWISTDYGLSRFDPETESFFTYDVRDGLMNNEFIPGAYHKGNSGLLYFGHRTGITAFFPEGITRNDYRPPVVMTGTTQGGVAVLPTDRGDGRKEIVLRWPHNYFEFECAALSYASPSENLFSYTLDGFDADWSTAGSTRSGRYTGLPGGRYTLTVRGSNNDGVWNQQGASLDVVVYPPFWGTWWFWAIVGVVLALTAGTFYRLRMRAVNAQRTAEAAVLEERSRIARELHDAVTQTLFSASLMADVLPGLWNTDRKKAQTQLRDLQLLNQSALAEMRTLLLELRPEALEKAPMGELLIQLCATVTGGKGIVATAAVDENCELPVSVKLAFYRIAQESLNNAARHSEARHIRVKYTSTAATAVLCIVDDGMGFDIDTSLAGHFGLGNMRERAAAIGAELELTSGAGEGTKIRLAWRAAESGKED